MRLEYSHDEKFEDRATQTVVNRKFEVPEFSVTERNGSIKICTESMELTYHGGEFSKTVFQRNLQVLTAVHSMSGIIVIINVI